MSDKPSQADSADRDNSNEQLAEREGAPLGDSSDESAELPGWFSPEMRPTLWRGLGVILFIVFVSFVSPLMRPADGPDEGDTDREAIEQESDSNSDQ